MKNVLIVSYYFPPINMIAAKRYGTMCKYFEKYGYKPYILTTRHNRFVWLDVKMELELPVNKDQIIRIGKPEENCVVDNFAIKIVLRFLEKYKFASRTISAGLIGWCEKIAERIDLGQLNDIDIVIGTFPPMENLFAAYYLSKKLNIPYIAELRDLISDWTEAVDGYRPARSLDCAVERYILKKAEGIITVTPGFRDILKRRLPDKKYKVIFNGWDSIGKLNENSEKSENFFQTVYWRSNIKYLYYAGSLYAHRLESFELLIKCIKKVNEQLENKVKLIVRSIGPKKLDIQARKMVDRQNMQEFVSILEPAPENVIRKEQKNAYINVVLSTIHNKDRALMTTIPGKVYELMAESAPILAVVPPRSDVEKVLHYTQKGITSISEKEIVDFILGKCEKYTGNQNIAFFSREKQAERLCGFMDELLM